MKGARNEQAAPLRRRGEVLMQAIYDAVLVELVDVGFSHLTMEGIAERARTGKMSLYRRWPSLQELLLDALASTIEKSMTNTPDTGSLREDLIAQLKSKRELLNGPLGSAISTINGERLRYPDLIAAICSQVLEPHSQILQILEHSLARGEICPEVITPQAGKAGMALLVFHYIMHGSPPDDTELEAIIDHVVLPALGVHN